MAFAVWTIENNIPVAVAPLVDLENKNALRATANGLTARSAMEFVKSSAPYSKCVVSSYQLFFA